MMPSQMSEPRFVEDFLLVQYADVSLSGLDCGDSDGNVANLCEGALLAGVEAHLRHVKSGFQAGKQAIFPLAARLDGCFRVGE